jgi:hypothetical protein
VTPVETPHKFGVISRFNERIWGGAILDDPDMLVYSRPFDPQDWTLDLEHPADGAGSVQQPSWDGDSFQALVPFGAQLLALKANRVWRILGTNPGEYVFKEQYGGGAPFARTVTVTNSTVMMLGREGVQMYDGADTMPYRQEFCKGIFRRMNPEALEGACGCWHQERYHCALPLDGSQVNNAVLVFDSRLNTWMLYEQVSVKAFLPTDDTLFFTSDSNPGMVFQWGAGKAALPLKWVSPWMRLGRLDAKKCNWTFYLSLECTEPVDLKITVETETQRFPRTIRFQPPEPNRAGPRRIVKCIMGAGRQFRFILESDDGELWRMVGGLQITCELDAD